MCFQWAAKMLQKCGATHAGMYERGKTAGKLKFSRSFSFHFCARTRASPIAMYRQAAAVSSGVKIHLSRRLFVGCLLMALLLFAGLFSHWHNRGVVDESESAECVKIYFLVLR